MKELVGPLLSPWLLAAYLVIATGCEGAPLEMVELDGDIVSDPDVGFEEVDGRDGRDGGGPDVGGDASEPDSSWIETGDAGLDGDAALGDEPGSTYDGDAGATAALPIDELDELRLVINLGDSLAAGYNADGRNGSGGHGYARLLVSNHPDYPSYDGHSLSSLYPEVELRDLGESGATSHDALENLRDASLPATIDGDVLVLLTCGGNDFNDDWINMALQPATRVIAATLQSNYREIFRILRDRYERPALGHHVVFLVTNVHDPTGGTGSVPATFDDGFCGTIHNFPAFVTRMAINNLTIFNDAIAEVTDELGGYLVDNHDVFLEHGMNAGADRWIDGDCVHPTNEGHHQLRRRYWQVLTGESL